ncbi:MAG: 30S ribosomal protein S12 methylthiotransferase RimO [Anaerolineae bacterium]|nr:30S ribosomal protein S12 methylthiotransferase RimO [Candidatus Roseilinea sp.]MDW8450521.1 30S ribosomal protein S12 methylthiotransferase RimO [Anaerolineae bacterium]
MKQSYYLLSLGCSKNTVDSDSMAQLLNASGYRSVERARQADVLIVNTCGFIGPARDESIRHLRELAERKKRGQLLIAAGCLAQLWGPKLAEAVPGLDGVIGTRRWMDIVAFIERVRGRARPEPLFHLPDEATTVGDDERGALRAAQQGASAYLKIADGCRRPCAFCTIPAIKGTMKSRPPELIVDEARRLAQRGVRELILIAQDLTDYGNDIGLRDGLAHLITDITRAAPQLDWVRLMYAYPGAVTERLIEVIATNDKVVKYLDIPLQHAHPDVLRRMRRPSNIDWVYRTIGKMRAAIPALAVRTTFIVGFPGETDAEFDALMQFVEEMQFDRVGVFTYSLEANTPSGRMPNQVPAEVAEARRDALMRRQQQISLAKNQRFIGATLTALIEGNDPEQAISVGRTYRDAPEVDGLVIIEGTLPAGEMVPVKITGALEYDLTGAAIQEQPVIVR